MQGELLKLPAPAPLRVQLTLPAGADFGPESVSAIRPVQAVPWLIATVEGTQVGEVEVVRFRTVTETPLASALESCTDPLGEYEAVI